MKNYKNLEFSRSELEEAMKNGYNNLINFVEQDGFKKMHEKMRSLQPEERPIFVDNNFLDENVLLKNGIEIPENVMIQKSAFGDRRPTLFAVKTWLPKKFHSAWENVNLTFDNDFDEREVTRDPNKAWRNPLLVDKQQRAMLDGVHLENVN